MIDFDVSRAGLIDTKRVALRRGVWFKWLSGIERAQVDLTIRIARTVRSVLLKNVLISDLGLNSSIPGKMDCNQALFIRG